MSVTLVMLAATVLVHNQHLQAGPYNQTVVNKGIEVWRNSTDSTGRSCVDCHGAPDGFDLAYWNLTADDIRRRDADHISAADSEAIVGLLVELRKKYDIVPENIRTESPFQPGGAMLPGASASERDAALMQSFQTSLPLLTTGKIDSALKASQAVQSILTFDINSQPIGIQLPRWSRDRFFGDSEGLITDWVADVASLPRDQASLDAHYAVQDTYLANPTEANFWLMYDSAVQRLSVQNTMSNSDGRKFQNRKYLSAMIGSHDLRMETLGLPRILDKPGKHKQLYYDSALGYRVLEDPMFDLGEAGNANETFGFPQSVLNSLAPNMYVGENVARGKDPWWWLGWMYNPGLIPNPTRQEYFPNGLIRGTFQFDPIQGNMVTHAKYMTTFTDVYNYRLPDPLNSGARVYYWKISGNKLAPFNPNPTANAATAYDPINDAHLFFNDLHRDQFVKFAVNIAKMKMYMIKEDLQSALTNGTPYWPILSGLENQKNEAVGSHDFIETQRQLAKYDSANSAHNEALYLQIRDLMRELKNGSTVPFQGNGTGLTTKIYDSLRFTNLLQTRTDSSIHYQPGVGGVAGAIYPNTDISVRWTGHLQARYTDNYEFSVLFPGERNDLGGVRIWVNGQLVYDKWDVEGGYSRKGSLVPMVAGAKVPFRVEYRQGGAFQQISVRWESSKELNDIIPKSQLYPGELPIPILDGQIKPNADTFVQDGTSAGLNFGSEHFLTLKNSSSTGFRRKVYLRFPLSAMTSPAATAELSLINSYVEDAITSNPQQIQLYLVNSDVWSESSTTWNNQPVLGALLGTVTVYRQGQDIRFNIKDALNAERLKDGLLSVAVVGTGAAHMLRFNSRESGDNGPLIMMAADSTPPLTIEAEDFSSMSGVSVSSSFSGYSGRGYADYGGQGTWAEWGIQRSGGNAILTFVYANGSTSDRRCEVLVNGTVAGTVSFPGTGAWTNWRESSVTVPMGTGTQVLRLRASNSSGGPNVDRLMIK